MTRIFTVFLLSTTGGFAATPLTLSLNLTPYRRNSHHQPIRNVHLTEEKNQSQSRDKNIASDGYHGEPSASSSSSSSSEEAGESVASARDSSMVITSVVSSK